MRGPDAVDDVPNPEAFGPWGAAGNHRRHNERVSVYSPWLFGSSPKGVKGLDFISCAWVKRPLIGYYLRCMVAERRL